MTKNPAKNDSHSKFTHNLKDIYILSTYNAWGHSTLLSRCNPHFFDPLIQPTKNCVKTYTYIYIVVMELLYGEKLSGEKTRELRGFVAIREIFLCEIWGCDILWHGKSKQSEKVFSTKIVFFTNLQKFLPRKFPAIRYTVKFLNNRANVLTFLLAVTCFDFVKYLLVQG